MNVAIELRRIDTGVLNALAEMPFEYRWSSRFILWTRTRR
jgi:hypothetical protein